MILRKYRGGDGGVVGEVNKRELFWWLWKCFWKREMKEKKRGKMWGNHKTLPKNWWGSVGVNLKEIRTQ